MPERAAVFIPPLDSHFGELTVRQTLEFAARVQGSLFAGVQEGSALQRGVAGWARVGGRGWMGGRGGWVG